MEEFIPVLVGIGMTWLVQFSKKHGKDPKAVLALMSMLFALVYGMAQQLLGVEYVSSVIKSFVAAIGTASAVYAYGKGYLGLTGSNQGKK